MAYQGRHLRDAREGVTEAPAGANPILRRQLHKIDRVGNAI
jgi:hypothetical protein